MGSDFGDPGNFRASELLEECRILALDAGAGERFLKKATPADDCFAVSQVEVEAGDDEAVTLRLRDGDVTRITAGAAIAIGDKLQADADGKAIPATVSGLVVIGKALTAVAADERVLCLIEKTVLP